MGLAILVFLNIIFPLGALVVVLYFLCSSRRRVLKTLMGELIERFTLKPMAKKGPYIWLHAASVGEVKSVSGLALKLKESYNLPVLITTTTVAGRASALKNKTFDTCLLAPLDFYFFIKRFIRFYSPKMLLIVEADLWPNMIYVSSKYGVDVGIINGRLSARSAKRYKLLTPLVKIIMQRVKFICAQSEDIRKRYIGLSANKKSVFDTGNIKYDSLNSRPSRQEEVDKIIASLGWGKEFIVTCGSTHQEEENLIINTAKVLKEVKFIIAPRHLERVPQIVVALNKSGVKFATLSSLYKAEYKAEDSQILLADTMGLLSALYAVSAMAFVGGSITKKGGHNFLEPAILGRPVMFGKYYYNTPDVAKRMLEGGGGILVSRRNFAEVINKYVGDKDLLLRAGELAQVCANSFKGATQKTLEVINNYERK